MRDKIKLKSVTLLGVDCINLDRIKQAVGICLNYFEFAEVKILTSLSSDDPNNIYKINPVNSTEKYSSFIINELYKYVDTAYVLIVQYDGFILNPKAWTNEFLKYDYIGAPWLVADWSVDKYNFPIELLGKYVVGNGGFSLRSKKLLSLTAKLSKQKKLKKYHPEDAAISVYYREFLEKQGIKFAPVSLAKQFSFEGESLDNYAWNSQLGFHGLKWTDISKWSKLNGQYKIDNPASDKSEIVKYL
jgi:hypothetical protein